MMGNWFSTSTSTSTSQIILLSSSATTPVSFSWMQILEHLPELSWSFPIETIQIPNTEKTIHGYLRGKLKFPKVLGKIKPTMKQANFRFQINPTRAFEETKIR